jgi:Fic-DOC domain mobile mystery protein B
MHFLAGGEAGQTPLDHDEAAALIPSWVTTREDLNLAEETNIAIGSRWASRRRLEPEDLLSDTFVRQLHRRMFGDVWRWAGTYRTTNKNLGVDHWLIREQVAQLCADARYWIENEVYEPDELAVRFHHRLVAIHPFPNGNGRACREIADLLIETLGGNRFSWGAGLAAIDLGQARSEYIRALQAADDSDIKPLLTFSRS